MTDPLPADVRAYLEDRARYGSAPIQAEDLLARYPKPAPTIEPGTVVLDPDGAWLFDFSGTWCPSSAEPTNDGPRVDAEVIARGGRRVHPARFHDHAETLRRYAHDLSVALNVPAGAEALLRIADDIDPEE